ncbi:MAG: hypothetical protein HY558_00230 [Euryarchaeota archaeon]|nr:hypothetical protein [Euryarchaeota archaeon]
MAEVIAVPRKEYEFLKECARILYEDIHEQFRPEFIRRVQRARRQLAHGKGTTFHSKKELRSYLDSL